MVPQTLKRIGLAIAFVVAAVSTAIAFPGGGVGGIGAGGVSGIGAGTIGNVTGANISPGVSGLGPTFLMPQRFRDLNVTGKVGVKKSDLPPNATVIMLRLDGQEIPMRLDTETRSADLQFNSNEGYARGLYQSILTKRVEVVGQQDLRDEIAQAAEQSKPLQIEGYVFDRTSPFLVVKSVKSE